jgi:hypothetical protein
VDCWIFVETRPHFFINPIVHQSIIPASGWGVRPTSQKQRKLIHYINRAEIVKNFTNFACEVGGGAIKFRPFIKRSAARLSCARVSDEVHRFLPRSGNAW